MEKKFLWKFHWECGRDGEVEALFVATESEVNDLTGRKVNFGEILGKHSEIFGVIEHGEIEKVNLESEIVEYVTVVLGKTWSGYNPLIYAQYFCEKCACSVRYDEFNREKNMCYGCMEDVHE